MLAPFRILCLTAIAFSLFACNSNYVPKQEGYFSIPFPDKKYQLFDKPGYPYTFEYPVYAEIVKDSTFFGKTPENPWWLNINFPQFEGRIYLSYKQIGGKYSLAKLVNDAYNLTNKHTVRAAGINDSLMTTPNGVRGVFFDIAGDVATAKQFFLTDSTHHFIRGSLYFDATPNADSLRPVNDFIAEDMRHLINTLRWKQ